MFTFYSNLSAKQSFGLLAVKGMVIVAFVITIVKVLSS